MESLNLKIAIIGAGNMGSAIARGLAKGKLIAAYNIAVSDISTKNLELIQAANSQIVVNTSNIEIIKNADIILLAVKPWLVETIANEIESKLDYKRQFIISIAAGVDFDRLTHLFDSDATIFRIIPNTAIDVLQSVSTISSYNATPDKEALVLEIFNELGKAFLVPENQLNAFMSLSSCGIAYAFRYIRAAMEGGVEMGIYPTVAKNVVLQTLRGAIELLEANDSHPEVEIDKVTTPGGITIKGLNEMEATGFTNAVIKGLKASHLK
ncbi:MAG: pyrroline-5-carboxylate reductase [Porphyromonadaceae bacterium CG2_30_38_12]|nr:MAG: pyrroline-5-carboxylate reductase [Porphyromonadaceae bacterium CG2_30_38_12]